MPRIFTESQQHQLKLYDNMSGSEIVLHYRTPTTKERNGYQNMAVTRRRNKIHFNQVEARLKYGLLLLTGFRDGDFVRVENGAQRPISCNPQSPDYCADWKEQVQRYAADMVMLLAAHVFDAASEIDDDDEPSAVPPLDAPSAEDLEGNLPETLTR